MTNSKYPRNPSRILTTAFRMAMAITLALARDRATGKAGPLYFGEGKRIKGMVRVWKEAKKKYSETLEQGSPDASVLLKVEHSIRRSFSRILLKTSVKYGNTETKRVKREEGNKRYLNILWDYAGGRLRDFIKARFSFPKPVQYEKSNGKPGYCYHGSKKTPFYPVMHNHIPELDFGDMIRSPLMELARQCLKYGVPIKEAKKYIDALLLKLIPFLDYVYTGRRSGRSNYVRDGLIELREVVNQIKSVYGTRNGQRQSITSEIFESEDTEASLELYMDSEEVVEKIDEYSEEKSSDEPDKKAKMHFLEKVIATAKGEGLVLDEFFQKLKDLLDDETLTIEDSKALLSQAKEQSRRIGIRIHRAVAKNFQSPFRFNGIVFHGKDMAYDNSGLILLSEVSVDGGRGKVDLLLARAKKLVRVDGALSRIVCEPFMVVDLKTKSAFDFDIYGIETRTKESNDVVREFVLERREQTDEEWENVLSNTPRKEERLQLDAYEKALLTDYQRVMRKDPDAQESLVKAVVVVDSFQKWSDISRAILPLVLRAYNGCIDGTLSKDDYLIPIKDEKRQRIAMRMLSVTKPTTDTIELDIPIPPKSFSKTITTISNERGSSKGNKKFILYLTVPGRGSPAQSAAVIAERWHGLEYAYSFVKRQHRDVFWFDLVGEYGDSTLRKKQFKLGHQTEQIKRFFKSRVQMNDLSTQIESCIYGGKGIGTFRKELQDILGNARNPLIVVSGWETLRKSTPSSYGKYLDEVATTIIQAIPAKSTTLWFARPVPIAQNNTSYSTRCVAPFYQGMLWQSFSDTIVWNVAAPPNHTGTWTPSNDHERCIFIEAPGTPVERIHIEIEPLRRWGDDFRSGKRKDKVVYHKGAGCSPQERSKHIKKQLDKAIELIPHLLERNKYSQVPKSDSTLGVKHVPSGYDTSNDLEPLLAFNPYQIHGQIAVDDSGTQIDVDGNDPQKEADGRIKILLPMTSIDRRREYRPMELGISPQKRTTLPPSEHYLAAWECDAHTIARTEIQNLRDVIKFLRCNNERHLKEILGRISEVLGEITDVDAMDDADTLFHKLRFIHQILETNIVSKDIWKRLFPFRSTVPRDLTQVQKEHVISVQKRHPDILMITGNHLFLLTLVALLDTPTISFTETIFALWDYIHPWHIMGLGFRPEYPTNHTRGRSVLDRHNLLKRLYQLVSERNKTLEQHTTLTNVRYGQLISPLSSASAKSKYLWLLFQRASGIFDMNAALLDPRGIDPSLSLHETLEDMVSEQTYWSESDLGLLSKHAKLQGNEFRLPVMIANQQGLQVFWIADGEYERWKPLGHIQYRTRKFEDVTLVRTITLSADPHLRPVEYDDARRPIHSIEDLVDTALYILNKGLEGCTRADCKVSLDEKERLYKVAVTEQNSGKFLGELLINRTTDLLEILRRSDNECEPVIVNGKRVIWNRFRNITYDKDVSLITSWVNRSRPFPGMSLGLPPSAHELMDTRKEHDVTLELYHDAWTCPLRDISLTAIKKARKQVQNFGSHHLFRHEGHWAEPDRVSNEPGLHHGSCWRIHVDTPHMLTAGLKELMDVRFTGAQLRALLSPQELVFEIQKNKEWATHTFRVVIREKCVGEAKESWHLRMLLEDLTGKKYALSYPGVYKENPDQWSPYVIIEPEYIVIGLRDKVNRTVTMEKKIPERNVALRENSEVVELLEHEMEKLLVDKGITADRRMITAIRTEIEDIIDSVGVHEDKAIVDLDYVKVDFDSVGGRVLYVYLASEYTTHNIPVTKHLGDIKDIGRIGKDEFVDEVKSALNDYNLSEGDLERAVKRCLTIMRREKLIRK